MRFLTIYSSPEQTAPPTAEEMAAMGKLIAEMQQAGVLLGFEGCLPSAQGALVRRSKGKVTVIDGPFTEAKEVVGGFALLETRTKEEAISWTKKFLEVAGDGVSEIRRLHDK